MNSEVVNDPVPDSPSVGSLPPPKSLRAIIPLCAGQMLSILGSSMTSFGFGVWVLRETGSIVQYSLLIAIAFLPSIFASPLAGAFVDRIDRKKTLLITDGVAPTSALVLLILLLAGQLSLAWIYPLAFINSLFNAMQFPALGAAITQMVPKEQFGRANGMLSLAQGVGPVLAPIAAGFIFEAGGRRAILFIDAFAYLVSLTLLIFATRIPSLDSLEKTAHVESLRESALYGWFYLRDRPPLMRLLMYFVGINLLLPSAQFLIMPLVLATAGPAQLGVVMTLSLSGALIGGLAASAWGGPRRQLLGVLALTPLLSIGLVLAGLRPWLPQIAFGYFVVFFAAMLINSCSQTIWQKKVAADVQGRVFAMRRLFAHGVHPLAYLVAGPIAQNVFEPAMSHGRLGELLGPVIGAGPGRGLGLFTILLGGCVLLVLFLGLSSPKLLAVERDLPDAN